MNKIKRTLCLIGSILGNISSIFDKLLHLLKSIGIYIYSGYQLSKFASIGYNSVIEKANIILNPQYIYIGSNVSILKGLIITAIDRYRGGVYKPTIKIGNNVNIGRNCHISCINSIIFDDNVLIGAYVTIVDNAHGKSDINNLSIPPAKRELYSKGEVFIGKNVWIGDKVTILPGVNIGDGCIIGANSVVTKDIPANSIAAGCPAKIIRTIQ